LQADCKIAVRRIATHSTYVAVAVEDQTCLLEFKLSLSGKQLDFHRKVTLDNVILSVAYDVHGTLWIGTVNGLQWKSDVRIAISIILLSIVRPHLIATNEHNLFSFFYGFD
jgi:hypothetical protein